MKIVKCNNSMCGANAAGYCVAIKCSNGIFDEHRLEALAMEYAALAEQLYWCGVTLEDAIFITYCLMKGVGQIE